MNIFFVVVIAYLLGSIPWSLVIGKVFYNKDIRNYGSGNLGGTNAGRILGGRVGLLVILLDALKAFIIVCFSVLSLKDNNAAILAGLFACLGHCFPIFCQFRGGKGVATVLGYTLAIALFVTNEFALMFLLPAFIFILILAISKMVSLSSIIWLLSVSLMSFIVDGFSLITISFIVLWIFVTYRHQENIFRIINGAEKKITWIK